MTDWKATAAEAVQAFDVALGRPPFPLDAPDALVGKAEALLATLKVVAAVGRLKSLDGVAEVTTTLPILCASLREGTPNHTPCLRLYRPLLLAAAHVSALSTYPVLYLLRDAEALLASPSSSSRAPSSSSGPGAEDEANEVALFTFMALTQSLTPAHLRRFLRLPPADPQPAVSRGGKTGKKAAATPSTAKKGTGKGEAAAAADTCPVARAVLYAVLDAPLSGECRAVVESFLDNTAKFLACVGGDGDLAGRILDIYGARLVPNLKPSSLLPCLDAALLDYFVDVVAASQRVGHLTLLSSHELRDVACRSWELARLERLATAAASRVVRPEEALPSLLVYVFLYAVFCALQPAAATCDSTTPTNATGAGRLSAAEADLIVAVSQATVALLRAERAAPPPRLARPCAYALGKTGLVYVQGDAMPSVAEPLHAFMGHLLARPSVEVLWRGGLHAAVPGANRAVVAALVQEVGAALELRWHGVLEAVLVAAPGAEPRADPNKSTTGKPKGKQKGVAAVAGAGGTTATGAAATEQALPPIPLSELLGACCRSLLLVSVLHGAPSAPPFSQEPSCNNNNTSDECANPEAGEVAWIVRAYAYLLQHQPQRLSTALWCDFGLLLTTALWRWVAAAPGPSAAAQLPLTAVSTTCVLQSFTADTGSLLWLCPLALPSLRTPDATLRTGSVHTALEELWHTANRPLWLAVIRAAAAATDASTAQVCGSSVDSPLRPCLAPVSSAVLVGAVCGAWSDEVLADVATALAVAQNGGVAADAASVLLAGLTRLCTSLDEEDVPLAVGNVCAAPPRVSTARARSGLQRLLTAVRALQAAHLAAADAAIEQAQEAGRQRVQAELRRLRELEAAHHAFTEVAEAKKAAKAAEQLQVQAELVRRQAARAARRGEDTAVMQRRRAIAMETLRRKAALTRAEAEAARRQRFADYQRRLESECRVSVFLGHLQLPTSRVMETREALRAVLDRISPDDLLEFLVTGKAEVPADMRDDESDAARGSEDEGESDVGNGRAGGNTRRSGQREAAAPRSAAPPAKPPTTGPRPTGERRDFWAEVLDSAAVPDATTSAKPAPADVSHPQASPGLADTSPSSTGAGAQASSRRHSFHYRVAPLMDLFCYDDGDEFGRVPEVFPTVRLRVAARVWPPSEVQPLGFADLREAFHRMQDRGLVRLRDGLAQLTLLGFRYHYPFHDAEGMLEVHLRESRERVRVAVEARRQQGARLRGGSDVDNGEDAQTEAEDGETEGEWSEDGDGQALLPEVEFGI